MFNTHRSSSNALGWSTHSPHLKACIFTSPNPPILGGGVAVKLPWAVKYKILERREVLAALLWRGEVTSAGFVIQICVLYALILDPRFVFVSPQMFQYRFGGSSGEIRKIISPYGREFVNKNASFGFFALHLAMWLVSAETQEMQVIYQQ